MEKLHNDKLNDLHSSPNIFRFIKKTKIMRWAGHVTRLGYRRGGYGVLVRRKPRERDHLEEPNIHGKD
jgi:hypothetical protein